MTPKQASQQYFELLQRIEVLEKAGEMAGMLESCRQSMPLIPLWIKNEVVEFGSFGIGSIPAIETGCKYWAALDDRGAIGQVEALVRSENHLRARWLPVVQEAYRKADIAVAVFAFVRVNPGFIQSKLAKALGFGSTEVRDVCYYLEKTGNLRRAKSGSSYSLHAIE